MDIDCLFSMYKYFIYDNKDIFITENLTIYKVVNLFFIYNNFSILFFILDLIVHAFFVVDFFK